MKNAGLIMLLVFVAFSCNSRKEGIETNQISQAISEQDVINSVENVQVTTATKLNAAAKKILSKKINPETFNGDMKTIEESGFYSKTICDALRQNYKTSQGYASNAWTMTYKEALEAVKKGIDKGKMIDNLNKQSSSSL